MAAKRRRKRVQRVHSAKANVHVMELSKAGTSIDLELFADQEKIGTLIIGRGSLTWYGKKWRHGRRFSCSDFATHMEG